MRCADIRIWFSPWLDGQLGAAETRKLEAHLAECAACRQELTAWREISGTLQAMAQAQAEVKAPAGFSAQVMQQIKSEADAQGEKPVVRPKPAWWRYLVATAAAFTLLTYGSLNLMPQLGKLGPGNWLAERGQVGTPTGHVETATPEKTGVYPGTKDPAAPQEEPLNHGAVAGENPVEPVETTPAPSIGETEPGVEPEKQEGHTPALGPKGETPPTPVKEPMVFLNKERAITSTLLQLKVTDLEIALAQAKQAGNQVGAKHKTLALLTANEGQRAILRLVVAREKAPGLVKSLTELGYQLGQEEENQMITRRFTETLEQYRALVAELNATKDRQTQAQLSSQVAALEQQLTTWNEEAEEQIIMLSLESN